MEISLSGHRNSLIRNAFKNYTDSLESLRYICTENSQFTKKTFDSLKKIDHIYNK